MIAAELGHTDTVRALLQQTGKHINATNLVSTMFFAILLALCH